MPEEIKNESASALKPENKTQAKPETKAERKPESKPTASTPKSEASSSAVVSVTLLGAIRHDKRRYAVGETLEMSVPDAERLVKLGVATIEK